MLVLSLVLVNCNNLAVSLGSLTVFQTHKHSEKPHAARQKGVWGGVRPKKKKKKADPISGCLLDSGEQLRWWLTGRQVLLSTKTCTRGTAPAGDIQPHRLHPAPHPTSPKHQPPPPPTQAGTGLYENIINSIRVCKFHEPAILPLNFLTGCQNNLGCDIWRTESWITKSAIPGWNPLLPVIKGPHPFLSHSLTTSLLLKQPLSPA